MLELIMFLPINLDITNNNKAYLTYALIFFCVAFYFWGPQGTDNTHFKQAVKVGSFCAEHDELSNLIIKNKSYKKNIDCRKALSSIWRLPLDSKVEFEQKLEEHFSKSEDYEDIKILAEDFFNHLTEGLDEKYSFDPKNFIFKDFILSKFSHASIMHLLGNIFFLWLFGRAVESHLGKFKFLTLITMAMLSSSLFYTMSCSFNWGGCLPVLGASGFISGILGSFLFILPKANVTTFSLFLFRPAVYYIPASLFLSIYLLSDLFGMFYDTHRSVAFSSHVGGFILGYLYSRLFSSRVY